ncbi:MAG: heme biosynthesis HemY N-terminal domain-containing protein [Legionellaceae bacterium]|nr:heme biosynthesis HemY N-terminal domain-containing protein [Legionellaceae bacterium]
MIIKTIFIFLLLLGSVYLGVYLQQDSGYVLVVLDNWTIETTLWVLLITLLIGITAIYFVARVFNRILSIPHAFRRWRSSRKSHKSQEKTRQGLIEFNEGHWKQAKKNLIDGLQNSDTPLLNYLTAARAAQEMGDNTLRDNYLREAQQSMPEAKIAVELTQAQLQIANNQWEQALATLKHLQGLSPKHPYVLKLLLHLYEKIKDWPQLISILPVIKKYQILSKESFLKTEQHAYAEELKSIIKQDKTAKIDEFIDKIPKELKLDPEVMYIYAKFLISKKDDHKAEKVLHKILQKQIDSNLLELYGKLNKDEVKLSFLESLLKNNANSSSLFLCLAQVSCTKQLWGSAQDYIEESIKINPTSTAYKELGRLYEIQNDIHSACDAYRKGLEIIERQ